MTIPCRVRGRWAGAAAVCLLAGLLAGCTESRSQGVYEAQVVGTETDDAGRVVSTLVDVEFVVSTTTSDETCTVVFYDAAGGKLNAPNSTTKDESYTTRGFDDPQYNRPKARKYNQQIKVGGVPRTAELDC